jgi:hypothetical protein
MAQKKRYSKRVFANIRVSSVKQTGWGLNIWNGIFIVGLFDDFVHQEITFLVSLSRRIPWGAMGFFFRTTRELEYLFIFQNLTLGYMTKTQNQIFFFLNQNQNIFFEKNHGKKPMLYPFLRRVIILIRQIMA